MSADILVLGLAGVMVVAILIIALTEGPETGDDVASRRDCRGEDRRRIAGRERGAGRR